MPLRNATLGATVNFICILVIEKRKKKLAKVIMIFLTDIWMQGWHKGQKQVKVATQCSINHCPYMQECHTVYFYTLECIGTIMLHCVTFLCHLYILTIFVEIFYYV